MTARELYKFLKSIRHPGVEDYGTIYEAVDNYGRETGDFSYEDELIEFQPGGVVRDYAIELYNQMEYEELEQLFDIDFDIEDSVEFYDFITSQIAEFALYKMNVYGYYEEADDADIRILVDDICEDLREKL